jgi:serine protease
MRSYFTTLFAGSAFGLFLIASHSAAVEQSLTSPRARAAAEAAAAAPAGSAAAAMPVAPSRIIVKYRENPQSATPEAAAPGVAASAAQVGGVTVQSTAPAAGNSQIITLDRPVSDEQLRAIAESIARNPNVEYAEPERIMRAQQVNDPRFGEQWDFHQAVTGIRVSPAWGQSTGKGVVVAVIDTGIRNHADIAAHLVTGFDFISNPSTSNDGDGRDSDATDPGDWCVSDAVPMSSWHGLHVAGTISAITNNNLGVAGIARDAQILPVRVLGQCGGSNIDISAAILWAAGIPVPGVPLNPNPARVINLSLGGAGPCGQRYTDVIRQVRQRRVTVVVSAGNSDSDVSGFSPANCEGVISVAATNRQGARSYFGGPGRGSNYGTAVKIAAPGGETYLDPNNGILSTLNDGIRGPGADSYEAYQGTSMAAPHVAGVIALMYEVNPTITPDEILSILQRTSQPFPAVASRQCDTKSCGAGIIDAAAAVAEAAKTSSQGRPTATAGFSLAAGAPAPTGWSQPRQVIAPEGYVDQDGIWPSPRVRVCWEPGSNSFTVEKGWVKDAVETTIEQNSPVRFQSWGECGPQDLGIRIRIADEHPRSQVGRQWTRDPNNPLRFVTNAFGQRIEQPTPMVLNFTFDDSFQFCQPEREHCIRAIGVHEFLHALGFLHEQLRADAPADCRARFAHSADFPGYRPIHATQDYDADSHVNYCANMYRRPIRLSVGDTSVLQRFYAVQ